MWGEGEERGAKNEKIVTTVLCDEEEAVDNIIDKREPEEKRQMGVVV